MESILIVYSNKRRHILWKIGKWELLLIIYNVLFVIACNSYFWLRNKLKHIRDIGQMHTLKFFRSPVWLLLHKLSSPHYHYIRKMRRGDRLPLTQLYGSWNLFLFWSLHINILFKFDYTFFVLRQRYYYQWLQMSVINFTHARIDFSVLFMFLILNEFSSMKWTKMLNILENNSFQH